MNKIKTLFQNKRDGVLSIYFTAGYPQIDDTNFIIQQLEKYGVDMIEIGIPFSDSIADGKTIQNSNKIALDNGMNLDILFRQLCKISHNVNAPILLMGYINQLINFGMDKFASMCSKANVSGLIIPDMSIYEYSKNFSHIFKKYGIYNVFLIAPNTSLERIRFIDSISEGFIYMVSSSSITGTDNDSIKDQLYYFEKIKNMNLSNKIIIGFGISNKDRFDMVCKYSNGAIIGSAFIEFLSDRDNLKHIDKFINRFK